MEISEIIIKGLTESNEDIPNSLYLGTFGSYSKKELDIFFIDTAEVDYLINLDRLNENFESIKRFFSKCIPFDYFTFTSHLQKHICKTNDSFKIHVCYYPAVKYLEAWELPSFQAYLYDKAKFIKGNRNILSRNYISYRKRNNIISNQELLLHEIICYSQIAVNYYFYFSCNHIAFDIYDIFDKISYVTRFLITELLVETTHENFEISFWDWDELELYAIEHNFYKDIICNIMNIRANRSIVDHDILSKMFTDFFNLYSKTLLVKRSIGN